MAIGGMSARWPGRRANMVPMASTVTVQPSPSAADLNQSRTWRSRSVRVSRQMPPFGVAPILAVCIRSSHNRSGSMARFFISGGLLAGFDFRELSAPVLALEHKRDCGKRQQPGAHQKKPERDRSADENQVFAVRHDQRLPQTLLQDRRYHESEDEGRWVEVELAQGIAEHAHDQHDPD